MSTALYGEVWCVAQQGERAVLLVDAPDCTLKALGRLHKPPTRSAPVHVRIVPVDPKALATPGSEQLLAVLTDLFGPVPSSVAARIAEIATLTAKVVRLSERVADARSGRAALNSEIEASKRALAQAMGWLDGEICTRLDAAGEDD